MANYSELALLNYPNAGSPVLIMVLLSMIGLSATAIMLCVILKYDRFINRHTSLLTKTYNITEWVHLLYIPLVAFENFIILTGISFHPYICTGYVLQNDVLGHLFLLNFFSLPCVLNRLSLLRYFLSAFSYQVCLIRILTKKQHSRESESFLEGTIYGNRKGSSSNYARCFKY